VFEGFCDNAVLADLDPHISSVWRVIFSRQYEQLARRIESFEFNTDTVRETLSRQPSDTIERAFRTVLLNRVSRGGILAPGAGLVKNGENGKGMASRWYPQTLAQRIRAIGERRHSFSFTESDGIELIREWSKSTVAAIFIDPPYPGAGRRLYSCHELDHHRLFEVSSEIAGQYLMTYDDHFLPSELASRYEMEIRRMPMKSTHHIRKYELLISSDMKWYD